MPLPERVLGLWPSNSGPGALDLDVTVADAKFVARGDSADVLCAYSQFFQYLAEAKDGRKGRAPELPREMGTETDESPGSPPQEERIPLPAFLKKKALKKNPQIGLGIVLWAADQDGTSEVDVDYAKQSWRNSGFKVPTNIVRDIRSAVTEGWLEEQTKGKFSVTAYGRRVFAEFPDKE